MKLCIDNIMYICLLNVYAWRCMVVFFLYFILAVILQIYLLYIILYICYFICPSLQAKNNL